MLYEVQRRVVLCVGKQADDVYATPLIIHVIITMAHSPPPCPFQADICSKITCQKAVKLIKHTNLKMN